MKLIVLFITAMCVVYLGSRYLPSSMGWLLLIPALIPVTIVLYALYKAKT